MERSLRAVATDGHRLALCEAELETKAKNNQQVILPRKGVLELQRILGGDGNVDLAIGTSHVRAQIGDIRFTSKLIDGRFPEYGRVIPANPTKQVEADREGLRQALQRTAILSNEKYRGVRINLKSDLVTIQAHNPEQEEAEDQVEVTYKGDEVEIGFNVTYLLDALAAVDSDKVVLGLTDGNSSCLVRAAGTHELQVRRHADAALSRRRSVAAPMSLAELRIENLRCIESAVLEFSPELNLIAGENGAGKTSILEAIFLLGRGRSFRTRSSERLIRHQPAEAHRIRPYGRFAAQAGRNRRSPQTAAHAPGSTARTPLRCSSSPAFCRSRPSIRRSTSSSTKGRSAAAAGWTGWCSTWNQPLASTGPGTTGR